MTALLVRACWIGIGVVLVVLPLLPIPTWVGASDPGPNWGDHVSAWLIGLIVVVAGAVVAGRLGAHGQWRAIRWPSVGHVPIVAALSAIFLVLAGLAMQHAFAGNPHLTDEVAQLFQARVFASGRLTAPPPALPEFFLMAQTKVTESGWVAQYPPGQAALLAVGMLFSLEWMVNPLLGALGVALVYIVARGVYGSGVALVAAALWAMSAWVLFMSATYMNHVGAVTFALAAWAILFGPRAVSRAHFVAAGCLLAAAAMSRPLDAAAAAMPIVVWAALRRRGATLVWLVLGTGPLLGLWGYLNWKMYGSPFTLGYSVLYGRELGLGFHEDPWGRSFTPLTALSNAAVAVRRLHIYLFEWPIPALLPLGLWAMVANRRSATDLIVLAGILAAPALYFFYWHSGFYPGPRLYYMAAPFLIIGTARAWCWTWDHVKRQRLWGVRWDTALAAAAVIVLVWSWTSLVPSRWSAYQAQLATLNRNPYAELRARSVSRALVLVPESWSSRVATKLWSLGASPGIVERAFARADGCALDRLTRDPVAAPNLEQTLESLIRAHDTPAPRVPDWPDPALRLDPNASIDDRCRQEMRRDLAGFTLYGHLAWRNPIGLDSGIVFARDRYEENPALLKRYAGWPVWRYAPPSGAPGASPMLSGPHAIGVGESP